MDKKSYEMCFGRNLQHICSNPAVRPYFLHFDVKLAAGRSNSWKPPLRRRNFCPALGNHVPGTWHQTELLPIFFSEHKLTKFSIENLNLKTIEGNFLKLRAAASDKINAKFFVDYKRPRVCCAKLIQIGKAAQTIWLLIRSKMQAVQIAIIQSPKSEAVCFWDESKYAVGKSQPSKEILDLRF